jgi:hypothetical protein
MYDAFNVLRKKASRRISWPEFHDGLGDDEQEDDAEEDKQEEAPPEEWAILKPINCPQRKGESENVPGRDCR